MTTNIMASLGLDFKARTGAIIWASTLVVASSDTLRLTRFRGHETRSDLGEVSVQSMPSEVLGERAPVDMRVAWSLVDRETTLWAWHCWSESGEALAWYRPNTEPIRVPMGGSAVAHIAPPLAGADGRCDAMFVVASIEDASGTSTPTRKLEIVGVGFAAPRDGSASGRVLFRSRLEQEPVTCGAAQGLVGQERLVRLLVAEDHELGARIEFLAVSRDGPPTAIASAVLQQVKVVRGVQPALRIDADGALAASLIVSAADNPRSVRVVDISLAPGERAEPVVTMGDSRTLPADVRSGAVGFQSRPDAKDRRDWVLLLTDGSMAHNVSLNMSFRSAHEPVVPVQVAVMSQATYVLTLAGDKPVLEAVH